MTRTFLGLLIIIGVLAAVFAAGGTSATLFINIPSLVLVAGFVIGAAVFSFGPIAPVIAVITAMKDTPSNDNTENILRHTRVLNALSRYAIASGAAGTIIGLVQLLADLVDPAKLGPSMALCLLSPLYGLLLSEFVFQPLRSRLLDKHTSSVPLEKADAMRWLSLGLLPGMLVACGSLLMIMA